MDAQAQLLLQQLLMVLQQGSPQEKTAALVACESIAAADVNSFAASLLPVALSTATVSDAAVRVQLLSLVERVCAAVDVGGLPDIKYPVIAGCIEALDAIFPDETIPVRKRIIQTMTSIFPLAFRILSATPGHPKYWTFLSSVKTHIDALFVHPNEGIKANAAKYLAQVVIVQLPKDPADSDELPSLTLMAEALTLLNKFAMFLGPANPIRASGSFFSSVINCMHDIIKSRAQFAQIGLSALLEWYKNQPTYLTQLQLRSALRTLKIVLLSVLALPSVAPLQTVVADLLMTLGAKPYELEARLRRIGKRAAPVEFEGPPEGDEWKRQRVNSADSANSDVQDSAGPLTLSPAAAQIISNGLERIPLLEVVDAILRTFSNRSSVQWEHDTAMYVQSMPANADPSAAPRDPRLRASAAATPAPDPELIACRGSSAKTSRQGPAADINIAAVDQITLIGTATVDLDAILNQPPDLSEPDRESLLIDSLDRILSMEHHFAIPAGSMSMLGKPQPLVPSTNDGVLAARLGWMLLVVRVATRSGSLSETLRKTLLDFVVADFPKRVDLAVLWLNEELLSDEKSKTRQGTVWFDRILDARLSGVRRARDSTGRHAGAAQQEQGQGTSGGNVPETDRGEDIDMVQPPAELGEAEEGGLGEELEEEQEEDEEDEDEDEDAAQGEVAVGQDRDAVAAAAVSRIVLRPNDRAIARLLVDAPELTNHGLELIISLCKSPLRAKAGIAILRELIVLRPSIRDWCLSQVLGFCSHPDPATRTPAVAVSLGLYHQQKALSSSIAQHALESIRQLQRKAADAEAALATVPDADGDATAATGAESAEAPQTQLAMSGEETARHLELYLGLCPLNDTLLHEIFGLYPQYPAAVRQFVQTQIVGTLTTMAARPEKLLDLIASFPAGSEDLVLKIMDVLLATEHAPAAIQQAVTAYFARNLEARFLLIIMPSSLGYSKILDELPKLVQLLDGTEPQREIVRAMFLKLVEVPADEASADGETRRPPVTPAELLIKLHQIEDDVGLAKTIEATMICFAMPHLFTQEALAVVIQQLSDLAKLPTIFMRTVIQSLNAHKGLVSFVVNIMSRLILKQVWNNKQIWQGFIRCCMLTFPSSIPLLLKLPKAQAIEVISGLPQLRVAINEHVEQLPTYQRTRHDYVVLLQLLDEAQK
ncbi:Symplekin tight junction protein C terminal-domain-containing protein [Entophlyctis helioformis]|nr:Symplekin tight junction protein C terminal-domain-containing protein [Entophlyctis helioformis]